MAAFGRTAGIGLAFTARSATKTTANPLWFAVSPKIKINC
jgi:hypothetical protein